MVYTGDMFIAQSRIVSKHVTDHACGVVFQTPANYSIFICSWKQIGQDVGLEHCWPPLVLFHAFEDKVCGCDGVVRHAPSQL